METKRFTIVDTRTNGTKTIETTATTLGELKADLRRNGINPDGMSFQEGITKTEFTRDDAVLPHDVAFKGGTTNNLVFRLTQTEKKIKSGAMTRQEMYNQVKKLGLEKKVVERFGKNYTQVKNTDLHDFLTEHTEHIKPAEQPEGTNCCDCSKATAAIAKLVDLLEENDYLDGDQADEVRDILNGDNASTSEADSIYSDDEIAAMFD
jgi:hypothetical protein